MPRVYRYKTQARRKHADKGFYRCSKCGADIEPGQDRYEWSFRYGGTYRRHVSCGMPRQSELTQSKMSGVYAATEGVEDLFGHWTDPEELTGALESAADEIQYVVDEYREAAEHFGGQGENAERADELERYADDLRNVDLPERDDPDESLESWQERVESEVSDAISQCPY